MKEKYTVYIHKNKLNEKLYVGQTCREPEKRWRKNGKGYCKEFQPKFYNAIIKYGWDNFEHEIVQSNLSKDDANKLEIMLIEKFNSIENGYNITSGGSNISNNLKKSVYQMTYDKTVVSRFDSIYEATAKTKINHISKCCLNKKTSSGGYYWCFVDNYEEFKPVIKESKVKVIRERTYQKNGVYQLTPDGKIITKFNSVIEASRALNISSNSIVGCCKGRMPSHKGFCWCYTEDIDKFKGVKLKKRFSILQMDLNENVIKRYKSMVEASKETSIERTSILRCCKNELKTAGGFKWKYEETI